MSNTFLSTAQPQSGVAQLGEQFDRQSDFHPATAALPPQSQCHAFLGLLGSFYDYTQNIL